MDGTRYTVYGSKLCLLSLISTNEVPVGYYSHPGRAFTAWISGVALSHTKHFRCLPNYLSQGVLISSSWSLWRSISPAGFMNLVQPVAQTSDHIYPSSIFIKLWISQPLWGNLKSKLQKRSFMFRKKYAPIIFLSWTGKMMGEKMMGAYHNLQ